VINNLGIIGMQHFMYMTRPRFIKANVFRVYFIPGLMHS